MIMIERECILKAQVPGVSMRAPLCTDADDLLCCSALIIMIIVIVIVNLLLIIVMVMVTLILIITIILIYFYSAFERLCSMHFTLGELSRSL